MSRVKVLVVEDEPLIAIDIESVLDVLGCDTVGPAAFLTEAEDLATRETFDCAILDVNVRGGAITPVAQRLIDRGVPILLTTGYSDWALAEALSEVPRLRKPYTSEQLESEIRSLCARVKRTDDNGESRDCGLIVRNARARSDLAGAHQRSGDI